MSSLPNARLRWILLCSVTFLLLVSYSVYTNRYQPREEDDSTTTSHQATSGASIDKLHVLLTASNPDVNLCKTLLTAAVLGYPTPTLIGWNQTFDAGHLLGGGSHVVKISGVLEWLEAQESSRDNDLVLMMDGYDIWFQLRMETLLSRYRSINVSGNRRLTERLGTAFEKESLQQSIIFGAGKRCAPNQVHTVACYPIPESPLPKDLYGANTDTIMGRNKYTSLRQQYLNSGYAIGPIKDMRPMFRRAWEKVQAVKDHGEWDNGSGGSDFMYHGSDQSIFNIIFGEQEFQREVMRRRHLSHVEKVQDEKISRHTKIEGTVVDDPLNPAFTHEPMEHKSGKPDEFGIGLDYFSELGQQTVNAEEDSRYLVYKDSIEEQTKDRKGLFDCPSRVQGTLPADVLSTSPISSMSEMEEGPKAWSDVPLYSNLCLDQIPVMIHHNGDKDARHNAWPKMWIQPFARKLMQNVLKGHMTDNTGGAKSQGGTTLDWEDMCPKDMEQELFRDIDAP